MEVPGSVPTPKAETPTAASVSASRNPSRWRAGMGADALREGFEEHRQYSLAKDAYSATDLDALTSMSMGVRDRLIDRWVTC